MPISDKERGGSMLPLDRCSGCTACAAACPVQCIDMTADRDGFLYPKIRSDACIHCGKCLRTCPVLNRKSPETQLPAAFSAKNRDTECRKESSSGGVFSALAEEVIAGNGVVFGAAVAEDLRIKHIAVDNTMDLVRLRGSKYVSSELGGTFSRVRELLRAGRPVLFCGTPCQVEGLLGYLHRPYDNLLTVDFICHGVPSAKVWEAYLQERTHRGGSNITSVSFRSKQTGWKNYSMKIRFADDSVYCSSMRDDPYLQAFRENISLRPSCHNCAFKGANRKSELSLADFWGIQHIDPAQDDNLGTSLVFVHSQKGHEILNRITDRITLRQTDAQGAIAHNSAMVRSVSAHHFRQYFFHMLGKIPFDTLVYSCFSPSYPVRLHRMALIKLSAIFRRIKL